MLDLAGRRNIWMGEPLEKLRLWCGDKFTASQIVKKFKEELGIDFTRSAIIGKVHRTDGIRLNFTRADGADIRERPNRGGDHKIARRIRRKSIAAQYKLPIFPGNEPEPLRISLLDLTSSQCHWVCEGTDDHCLPIYCGHECVSDKPYCAHHYRRAYLVR